ncbi:MAG: tetratricopeptide repeat protein [Gammaproteobacteria bacterium]
MSAHIFYQQACQAYQAGDIAKAHTLCQAILKKNPKHADALHMSAILQLGMIGKNEQVPVAQQGKTKKKFQDALRRVHQALDLQPRNVNFLTTLGTFYRLAGHYREAEKAYRKALKYDPNEVIAHDGLGQTLWRLAGNDQERRREAESHFKKAIVLNPDLEVAYLSLAGLSLDLDDPGQAIHYGEQALARHPAAQIYEVLGQAYRRLGRDNEAETLYQQAIAFFPNDAGCYVLYAELLLDRGDAPCALEYARRGYALSREGKVLTNLAVILEECGDLAAAQQLYEQAFANTKQPEWQYRLAANRLKQGLPQDALQLLVKVLSANENITYFDNYSIVFLACFARNWRQMKEAAELLQQVPHCLSGQLRYFVSSMVSFALQSVLGDHSKLPIGDHETVETYSGYLLRIHYSPAYSPEEIYTAHLHFNESYALPLHKAKDKPYENLKDPRKRLRIGYLSQDFRTHSVAYFLEPILAAHDPDEIEVFCYYNNKLEDSVTARFKDYCTGAWRHCCDWSDEKLANVIRQDKIDILVDLMGHTGLNRILVFARKPAPVQISYLGYSDTTGLTAIDYRVTDELVEPDGAERFSSERLLRMPYSYFCYRPADVTETLPVSALPALINGYITFGSFNLYAKVTDDQVRRWAEILRRVPNSKLMLKVRLYVDAIRNFKTVITERFAYLGIAPERLVIRDFARSMEMALQSYHEVDICLDTHPYNGATTTCESLWMGCPVVSLFGQNHVSRMSLSILTAVGLGNLAVADESTFIETTVKLAQDIDTLQTLRSTMRKRLRASPLMDDKGFTRVLEQHYRAVWKEYCLESPFSEEKESNSLSTHT